MLIWSILLIKSYLKWCIHLSRSLFIYIHTWKDGNGAQRICTSAAKLTSNHQRLFQMEKRLQTVSYVEKDMAAPCQKKGHWHLWHARGWALPGGSFDFSSNFSWWILNSTMKSLQVLEEESESSTPGSGSHWKKVSRRQLPFVIL